jgi:hypothetical protein
MKAGSKLRGRPAKTSGKRTKKIDARFTEDEYRLIEEMEKALGLKKTELIRLRLLENSTKLIINSKELLLELDKVGTELGRAGNNINQLARYANTLQKKGVLSAAVAARFNELLENYNGQQMALETALRRIIRAMGR